MGAGRHMGRAGALVAAVAGATLLVACGGGSTATGGSNLSVANPSSATTAPTTPASPRPTTGTAACDFTATPGQPAPAGHNVGIPPTTAPRAGVVSAVLHTNQGDIPLSMPRAQAPCTVASFAFLATKGYFTNTPCHRLTAASSLKVLQCGDPTGQGTGGPGYTVPDENPVNLPSAGQGADVYPRGTVAMANTGQAHSGGSQFFLVYANSQLPPNYAVFGTVDAPGLAVLDKIAAAGVTAGGDPTDGAPASPVTITSATATG